MPSRDVGKSFAYAYNARDELVSAAPGAGSVQSFSYDKAGNMLTNSGVGTYEYPPMGSAHSHTQVKRGE